MRTNFARYFRMKNWILLFFLTYAVVQCAGNNFAPKGEYFPVFSWSLFTDTRDTFRDVEVEILRIGDVTYDPPRNIYAMPEHFSAAKWHDATLTKAARVIAGHLFFEDLDPIEKRRSFELTFLNIGEDIEYQYVLQRYHPLERVRRGTLISSEVLATFEIKAVP